MSESFESHYGPMINGNNYCRRDLYFCEHNLYNNNVKCYQLKRFEYSDVHMTSDCTKIRNMSDFYNDPLRCGFIVPLLPIYKYFPENLNNFILKRKVLNYVNTNMTTSDKYIIQEEISKTK